MSDYDAIIEKLRIRKAELENRLGRVETSMRKTYAKDWQEQSIERENDEVVDALDETLRTELNQELCLRAWIRTNTVYAQSATSRSPCASRSAPLHGPLRSCASESE
jgi:hypothetical protein